METSVTLSRSICFACSKDFARFNDRLDSIEEIQT